MSKMQAKIGEDMDEIKEHPILFSAPMVRAILEGRKTQTRRVVKPQPPLHFRHCWYDAPKYGFALKDAMLCDSWFKVKCPYGYRNHKLWVRETFSLAQVVTPLGANANYIAYRATYNDTDAPMLGVWKPSIFMPRWVSRITLEVTNIRVERLQDISEEDAMAEGLTWWIAQNGKVHYGEFIADVWETKAARAYARLWDTINAKRGYSWESNPFVWVVEFKIFEVKK
jgi:hypothetical protein